MARLKLHKAQLSDWNAEKQLVSCAKEPRIDSERFSTVSLAEFSGTAPYCVHQVIGARSENIFITSYTRLIQQLANSYTKPFIDLNAQAFVRYHFTFESNCTINRQSISAWGTMYNVWLLFILTENKWHLNTVILHISN